MAHRLRIPDGIYRKLADRSEPIGVNPNDYLIHLLIRLLERGEVGEDGNVAEAVPAAGRGRPLKAKAEDIPPDVERDATVSGFAGVARDGNYWKARIGREAVGGRFSTPEIAAIARHYAQVGFRLGRAAFFGARGLPLETAIDLAVRAGFSPVAMELDADADAAPSGANVPAALPALPAPLAPPLKKRGRKPAGPSLLFDEASGQGDDDSTDGE